MQIQSVREVVQEFAEVRFAYVFGSVAAGTARASSDLDVTVFLSPGAADSISDQLIEKLEGVCGRTIDLVDLSSAPPLLAHEIVKNGRLITTRDEDERIDFVTRSIARYLDTAHLRKVQHDYLRERVEARRGG